MKSLRPVIAEVRCECGKSQLIARNGMRITGDASKLINIGHVSRAKRKQAWGAIDPKPITTKETGDATTTD